MQESTTPSAGHRASRVLCLGVLVVGLCGLFTLLAWTAGFGLGWHAIHGGSVSFEGHRIRVPWDMMAFHSSDGGAIRLVRWAAPYPIFRSPAGMIFISRQAAASLGKRGSFDHLASVLGEPPRGYRLRAIRKLPAATGTVTCWEHVSSDSSSFSIECLSDGAALRASLLGSRAYYQGFYSALSDVTQVSPNR